MKRWMVSAPSFALLALVIFVTGFLNAEVVERTPLYFWTGTVVVFAVIWYVLPEQWEELPFFPYAIVTLASGLTGWLIHFSGGWNSPYFGLYLFAPLAAVLYGPCWPAALVMAPLNAISFIAGGGWPPSTNADATITQIALIGLSAAVGAFTAAQAAARQRSLQVSRRIAMSATAIFDLDQLLEQILQTLSGSARISSAYLLIPEKTEERECLLCRAAKGPKAHVELPPIPIGKGVTGRAAETGQLTYAPDVRQAEGYIEVLPHTRSELALPLKLGEQVIGVLNLESDRLRAFGKGDRHLLETVMPPIALAVNNALLIEQISQMSATLRTSAEQFSSRAIDVSDKLQMVTQSMEETAQTIAMQAKQFEETHQTTRKLIRITNQIASKIESAAKSSGQVTQATLESRAILCAVDEQAKGVAQMVDLVERLGRKTHLLALNAAIEAVRAGEYGRGFGVVADEIRALAEHSRRSTSEIAEKNHEMQVAISELSETANLVQRLVQEAESLTNDISQATQHQREQMDSIDLAMGETASAAEEVATITEEVTVSAEAQNQAMKQVQDSAHYLAELAEKLDRLIDRMHPERSAKRSHSRTLKEWGKR